MTGVRRFILLLLAFAASAQAADLAATLEIGNLRLRKDAPIPLEVRFQNPTPRLLEGRLEIALPVGSRKAGIHRSAEMVLQPGTQVLPLSLPPVSDAHPGDGIAAQLRWIGADGARELGEQSIGIFGIGGHEVVLAVARTERHLTDFDHARETSLNLESLRPTLDAASWLTLTTLQAKVATQSLPTHPLGWCAYDAVFLDAPAFAAANEKQLTSLARWVEAGGTVGVVAGRSVSEQHAAFLNRLSASEKSPVEFTVDPNGMLVRTSAKPRRETAPILLRTGLGRAFIATEMDENPKTFDSNEWHAAVAWLWRLRASEQRAVEATGRWSKDFFQTNQVWRDPDDLDTTAIWSAAAGFNALTPGAPRQIPLSLVAAILCALLLVVGPADWFTLGWLRKRRWTWIAFPIVCAGFTWWTAHLAGHYLGVADRTGCIRFVDLAEDGHVLRELRFALLLPARDREWRFDLRDAIAVSIPRTNANLLASPIAGMESAPSTNADSVSEWPSPSHFLFRRTLRQWSPAMVRITSFDHSTSGALPDWDPALAHFQKDVSAENWSPAKANNSGFHFEVPKAGGEGEPFVRNRRGRIPGLDASPGGEDDGSFARWAAFGDSSRFLGGLSIATSTALAGISDFGGARECPNDSRVVCAWRRTDGELLIYRRIFPAK